MAQRRLRVALDANVLIAGVHLPRWPHEVMRAALGDFFDVALPGQVIEEARRHLAEPAADLAVALAIASNCRDRPVGRDVVALGELGLSGEVRRVPQLERRLHEARRLGFKRAIVPAAGELKNLANGKGRGGDRQGLPPPEGEGRGGGVLTVQRVETLAEAMASCFTGD